MLYRGSEKGGLMEKAKYTSPRIRTSIAPKMALDIDKPCSFGPSPVPRSREAMRLMDQVMEKIGATKMDSNVVRAVLEEQGVRVEGTPVGYIPPKSREGQQIFDLLTAKGGKLNPELVRKHYTRGRMRR